MNNYSISTSEKAQKAITLVKLLQSQLVNAMESIGAQQKKFVPVDWLRDEGIHGGGRRYVSQSPFFNRASVNVSHVHYDDEPENKLASATAFSAIVHPDNPHLPSAHMHFSWTEMRDGSGYWRMMADLNPTILNDSNTISFNKALEGCTGSYYKPGKEKGDEYFYIPSLAVHRGVSHFYLEGFDRGDFDQDYALIEKVAGQMINTYRLILESNLANYDTYTPEEKQTQIDYHTLYMYQVLTLDKGTTAGILVHNQNDLGVFGSLPSKVNRALFHSWVEKTPAPYNELVEALTFVLKESESYSKVEDEEKLGFAKVIRAFYGSTQKL